MLLRYLAVVWISPLFFTVATAQTAGRTGDYVDYVWAAACRDCHGGQYAAWEKTKHARAVTRLSGPEREPGKCIGCHVTGASELAPKDVNANVQCEACHGPAGEHVRAAATGGAATPGAIVRKPDEGVCVRCHNDKGPNFKFFLYAALAPLVHQVAK